MHFVYIIYVYVRVTIHFVASEFRYIDNSEYGREAHLSGGSNLQTFWPTLTFLCYVLYRLSGHIWASQAFHAMGLWTCGGHTASFAIYNYLPILNMMSNAR